MALTRLRLLTAFALAIAGDQARLALSTVWPTLGLASVVRAQFEDPGFGDPAILTPPGVGGPAPVPISGGPGSFPVNPGPSAPVQPLSPVRPQSWPGGKPPAGQLPPGATPPGQAGPAGQMPAQPGGFNAPPGAVANLPVIAFGKKTPADPPYNPEDIVAHIGSEVIQANELLPNVNQQIAAIVKQHADEFAKLSPKDKEEQLNLIRKELLKRQMEEMIKIKLLLTEVHRKVPADQLPKHEKTFRDFFNTNELPRLREVLGATSIPDLENKLRQQGTSIDAQRRVFVERYIASSWLSQHVKDDEAPPTHQKMLDYYRAHIADWETPARARWEQISVRFTNFDSKAAAYRELARWGSDVQRGVPFAEVAKAHSQEGAAEDGGVHDWISHGSLKSTQLETALFTLPVGTLSSIIEDEDGFHIVRVLAREEAKREPFFEVQNDIKKALQDKNKEGQRADHIAKLRAHTPIITIFDEDFTARVTAPAMQPDNTAPVNPATPMVATPAGSTPAGTVTR